MTAAIPSHNSAAANEAEKFWAEAEELGRAILAQLEYFDELGVNGLPPELAPPPPPQPRADNLPAARSSTPNRPVPGRERSKSDPPAAPAAWAPQTADMEALTARTAECRGCPMADDRSRPPCAGRGSFSPLILFVGPDPAIFEGGQGQLLSDMIEKGLCLSPADYYVTSLLKCSINGGGSPPPSADQGCRPILDRQIALLRPRVVLALGRIPGQRLSGSNDPLGLLRPRTFLLPGLEKSWLRVSYGLEDMLDSIDIKREAWKDLLKIKAVLAKLGAGR